MNDLMELARKNEREAWSIVQELGIEQAWQDVGGKANLVGSLKCGLLMKHLDIDFHVYTDGLDVAKSFQAVAKIAAHPNVTRLTYSNLMDTDEHCLEWHLWYRVSEEREWQIDMIHILKGSEFDGVFEDVAERIFAALTPETRQTILRLKYETPDDEKIMGIAYYMAVLRDGVRSYEAFTKWREETHLDGIILWKP
ncbi:hypothetical protein [Cohaesibacter marisflavi]|uniref:hypothetical protein n=1 Tax=Cohaesibacter marisflavi TaxID=655353 RepID=UPI0029C7FDCC|nr:hypothetical protein [Cohaesibacter marisflavi]